MGTIGEENAPSSPEPLELSWAMGKNNHSHLQKVNRILFVGAEDVQLCGNLPLPSSLLARKQTSLLVGQVQMQSFLDIHGSVGCHLLSLSAGGM